MENRNIIDAWIQHPNSRLLKNEMFKTIKDWLKIDKVPDQIPIEMTLQALKLGGINKALVTAWWGPSGPLISNDEVFELVSKAPDLLVGIASVNLLKPREAVLELRRTVKEYGFKGLRILPWLWNLPPNDRRYYPLYNECIELDIPFCLQVGHTGPLCPSEPGRPIPYLDQVALDFPELKIVAGHIGFPWTNEMISMAMKYPNVYIDTSAYKPSRYPIEFVQFLKRGGRKKVLFASDYPMVSPKDCMDQLLSLDLDEETLDLFLYENSRSVFNL